MMKLYVRLCVQSLSHLYVYIYKDTRHSSIDCVYSLCTYHCVTMVVAVPVKSSNLLDTSMVILSKRNSNSSSLSK